MKGMRTWVKARPGSVQLYGTIKKPGLSDGLGGRDDRRKARNKRKAQRRKARR